MPLRSKHRTTEKRNVSFALYYIPRNLVQRFTKVRECTDDDIKTEPLKYSEFEYRHLQIN